MTGKRQASRARIEAEIMVAARAQLVDVGAAGLSLREIARELDMVSSAIYRYVDSRDALLTRLIVDAYDRLGATAEAAVDAHRAASDLDRWVATCGAIRRWAIDHRHEYLLLYGTPVPGYAAPQDTVDPGTRVTRALVAIVADAATAGRLVPPTDVDVPRLLAAELASLAEYAGAALGVDHIAAFLIAWTQLFGHISFELTNQTRGLIESHADFFELTTHTTGHAIGLR